MSEFLRRILRYLIIIVLVFLGCCLVAIIKNWSVFIEVIGSSLMSVISMVIVVGICIYLFIQIFRR